MKKKTIEYLVAVYIAMAVVTFGHAWKQCYIQKAFDPEGLRFIGSIVSSAAWPFYWSVQLWDKKP